MCIVLINLELDDRLRRKALSVNCCVVFGAGMLSQNNMKCNMNECCFKGDRRNSAILRSRSTSSATCTSEFDGEWKRMTISNSR